MWEHLSFPLDSLVLGYLSSSEYRLYCIKYKFFTRKSSNLVTRCDHLWDVLFHAYLIWCWCSCLCDPLICMYRILFFMVSLNGAWIELLSRILKVGISLVISLLWWCVLKLRLIAYDNCYILLGIKFVLRSVILISKQQLWNAVSASVQ